ncbi:Retrotransposon gag domain-containing protein [Dioscorea alata]|uniref:Retrotransposon gag domain-containing protein n=1 Tax=Dioscorea alata TaxID=55571 RepID=A0ACB7WTK6_DIOAL|nr:Retrotransposon gag domain-containing protein [Dioscorea alata]
MAEMMVRLQQLDKPSSSSHSTTYPNRPPLLPLPTTHHASPLHSSSPLIPPSLHSNTSGSTIRPPKLEIQLFDGDDVPGWLFQINHYFLFHQIPADQRLAIVAFYLIGSARQWFQWLLATDHLTTWEDFVRKLELRFCPSSFFNHEASLFKLKQKTTVTAFLQDFECLSTRVTDLSQHSLLNCFLSGIREDIQRELYILKPNDLHEAVGMAKLIEDKFAAAKLNSIRPSFPWPAPLPPPSTVHRPVSLPIKRLTPAEMASRREKGLCFNCDAKFTPGHKCNSALFLCLMSEQDDSVSPEEEPPPEVVELPDDRPPDAKWNADTPCISFHALMGRLVPSTLKLSGSINGKEAIVLVDEGSTNNFI